MIIYSIICKFSVLFPLIGEKGGDSSGNQPSLNFKANFPVMKLIHTYKLSEEKEANLLSPALDCLLSNCFQCSRPSYDFIQHCLNGFFMKRCWFKGSHFFKISKKTE